MKTLSTTIELVLRNPRQKNEKLSLFMDLYDKPITHRWLDQLKVSLKEKHHLEKNFCFLGWPKSHRNIDFLCRELNFHVKKINQYSQMGGWSKPYSIEESFSPELVCNDEGKLDQELMNKLHHHFAVLNGQVLRKSMYLDTASFDIKFSIRRLNLLCHELENYVDTLQNVKIYGPEVIGPGIIYSFIDCKRMPLQEEDYDEFEYRRFFGGVSVHYCQVGKRYDEAYEDRDKDATNEELSGLQYYTGEFDTFWGFANEDYYSQKLIEIKKWVKTIGKDPEDKKLSIGFLYIGEFNREKNFPHMKLSEIHDRISNYSDIYEVKILAPGKETLSCIYEYSDLDSNYSDVQIEYISRVW
jgi:hypothetical protein